MRACWGSMSNKDGALAYLFLRAIPSRSRVLGSLPLTIAEIPPEQRPTRE
jgi:hypothetical protein